MSVRAGMPYECQHANGLEEPNTSGVIANDPLRRSTEALSEHVRATLRQLHERAALVHLEPAAR
jgi:hypothetical protein